MKVGEEFKDGRYTVLHKLGWGHFSTVWMVLDEETGRQAAMKVGGWASGRASPWALLPSVQCSSEMGGGHGSRGRWARVAGLRPLRALLPHPAANSQLT